MAASKEISENIGESGGMRKAENIAVAYEENSASKADGVNGGETA
jgi:hypothetical protein